MFFDTADSRYFLCSALYTAVLSVLVGELRHIDAGLFCRG